jgi:guanine nucleotide-binding protein G(I)/G(S)/G(T) subunit beta-1
MFSGHHGYVSANRFLSEQHILSASGDGTCMLWDIPTQSHISTFGQQGQPDFEPFSLAINPTDPNMFVVGCVSRGNSPVCVVWDIRMKKSTHYFYGTSDVDSIRFVDFPALFKKF